MFSSLIYICWLFFAKFFQKLSKNWKTEIFFCKTEFYEISKILNIFNQFKSGDIWHIFVKIVKFKLIFGQFYVKCWFSGLFFWKLSNFFLNWWKFSTNWENFPKKLRHFSKTEKFFQKLRNFFKNWDSKC